MDINDINNVSELNTLLQSFKKGEWFVSTLDEGNTNIVALLKYRATDNNTTKIEKNDEKNDDIDGNIIRKKVRGAKYEPLKYILRIYGTLGLIDREKEIENCVFLARNNQAPVIRFRFNHGVIQDYVEGRCLKDSEMESEMEQIAEKMKVWHSLELGDKKPILFDTIEKWLELVKKKDMKLVKKYRIEEEITKYKKLVDKKYKNHHLIDKHNKGLHVCERRNVKGDFFDQESKNCVMGKSDTDLLQQHTQGSQNDYQSNREQVGVLPSMYKKVDYNMFTNVEQYRSDCIGFCHNDLLSGNILKLQCGSVYFIDYEYSGCNFIAFDIANHLAEYAGYEFVKENIPNKEKIKAFLLCYGRVDLLDEVLFFIPTAHLFWGLWALLKVGAFDYRTYGIKRIEEFVKTSIKDT